jgi:hypothetical protein
MLTERISQLERQQQATQEALGVLESRSIVTLYDRVSVYDVTCESAASPAAQRRGTTR